MSNDIQKNPSFLYARIAGVIQQQILDGILRTGDKLPSLRTICREYGVSQNTAMSAYYDLESKGLIESRPQSGYYVRYPRSRRPSLPNATTPSSMPHDGDPDALVSQVYGTLGEPGSLPLSLGTPANELLPIAKLNKGLMLATRSLTGSGIAYDKVEGSERLRRQIARWAFAMECNLGMDDVITTSGCLNALSYCLMAVADKGDTIAMESPVSFGMLRLAQALGLRVLELPMHAQTGVDLNAYEHALREGRVKASLLIPNFSNPLGSCMPDEHKREAVRLAELYNVPLIENDLNGDVYFGTQRPKSCKTYDRSGLVLWCGSVSKTLAPGYRVGWVAPGRFREQVLRMKLYHSISTASITQEVVAGFLETGRYENHLRKLRRTLHANQLNFARAIADYFPEGTRASCPQGGFVQWVELPRHVDALELYGKALSHKISFAPGRIFTLQNQYGHCLRLNYGLLWNDELEGTLRRLGELAKAEV
ncbi:aminotransferase-like domain-containing protein [Salmonirosea aquatica]|uniref:Aminotransferase class I/II-fold pyridoxal phosphate-dependent enzyme n=1 Tax=Salmonirosea aquatica TaxID=2654236 RepID=A0A7C9BUJ3_9BACT|nr:aminotransferase class I/II-fold pyridoxal phosphate-dependent enzyme [Cytophagaceae bacterium SJW1-29]